MNLYVSNLAYSLSDEELRQEFAAYGTVAHARVVLDRETNRSRGFGFVDMPDDAEARAAIEGLNNAAVGGRPLKVVEARPREERPPRRDSDNRSGSGAPAKRRDADSRSNAGGAPGGGFRDDYRDDDRRRPRRDDRKPSRGGRREYGFDDD